MSTSDRVLCLVNLIYIPRAILTRSSDKKKTKIPTYLENIFVMLDISDDHNLIYEYKYILHVMENDVEVTTRVMVVNEEE